MRSAANHGFGAICSVLLSGIFCFQGDAAMRHEQFVESPEQATRTAIEKFNEAFNRHDADALATLLTEDTVFEDTSPIADCVSNRGIDSVCVGHPQGQTPPTSEALAG